MKTMMVFAGLLMAGAMAAVPGGPLTSAQTARTVAFAPPDAALERSVGTTFVVRRLGGEQACRFAESSPDGKFTVRAESGCRDVYAPLVGVTGWSEEKSGDVVLTDSNGNVVVVLGHADGHAYESILPQSAMLTVVAEDNR